MPHTIPDGHIPGMGTWQSSSCLWAITKTVPAALESLTSGAKALFIGIEQSHLWRWSTQRRSSCPAGA